MLRSCYLVLESLLPVLTTRPSIKPVLYPPAAVSTISPSPRLSPAATRVRRQQLARSDRRGARTLRMLTIAAGLTLVVVMAAVAYQVVDGATMAINRFGLGFVTSTSWNTSHDQLGAMPFIYGTLVSSVISLFFATLLGVSIGLFLALMAPGPVAAVVGPMVEMLAAVPSVVLGLIGIIVISPFTSHVLEPVLHSVLGFLPFFGPAQPNGSSLFTASLVLTIMVVPIISALSRDIFRTVPKELREGAEALGATRWETIRGVVLPTTAAGVTGACVLGFLRALGEAIAVVQVVGNSTLIHADLFLPGSTIGAAIANQFLSPEDALTESSLYYLALILFVVGVVTNLLSRYIAKRGVRYA